MISYDNVKALLELSILVYKYDKTFTMEEGETWKSLYLKRKDKTEGGLSDDIIEEMGKKSPDGHICRFVDDTKTDLQAFVSVSHNYRRICVTFRGSESKKDWLYDFKVIKKQLDEGEKVHSGFYGQLFETESFLVLKEEVNKQLSENPYYEVFISGHSLGGALSTLFGYLLSKEIINHVTVVSFASPRVGNIKFKELFERKQNLTHIRIVNKRDVITATPMIGYHHVGVAVQLSDKNLAILNTYNKWWEFSLFKKYSVSEHYIDKYYERFCKLKIQWKNVNVEKNNFKKVLSFWNILKSKNSDVSDVSDVSDE